jgi:NadR type nicotinamide-nucleotide adenylyltransferase
MKTGLTLGKFAPLHHGHEELILKAWGEVDHLIVIIYDSPKTTNIPLPIRAKWIRTLYPTVEVIETWDGPEEYGDTPEIKNAHEAHIKGLLKGREITHFYSCEFYGEHMSKALNAIDCRFEKKENRLNGVPISGTEIRLHPYDYRNYISDIVYKDLITNVVFLGAPSSGKTTIAQRMAEIYGTQWMPEYGREYWEKFNVKRRLNLNQLVDIADGHILRENGLLKKSNKYLFTDTNALTTSIFSLYYHERVHPLLKDITDKAVSRYDLVFLCDIDIPYEDTADRSGEVNRMIFQKQIIADLTMRKIPYIVLSGDLQNREEKIVHVLNSFSKFNLEKVCLCPLTR